MTSAAFPARLAPGSARPAPPRGGRFWPVVFQGRGVTAFGRRRAQLHPAPRGTGAARGKPGRERRHEDFPDTGTDRTFGRRPVRAWRCPELAPRNAPGARRSEGPAPHAPRSICGKMKQGAI